MKIVYKMKSEIGLQKSEKNTIFTKDNENYRFYFTVFFTRREVI